MRGGVEGGYKGLVQRGLWILDSVPLECVEPEGIRFPRSDGRKLYRMLHPTFREFPFPRTPVNSLF